MAVQGRKIGQPMTPKKTKPSLKKTVDALTAIAEKHLSAMPEEEREKRIAAARGPQSRPRRLRKMSSTKRRTFLTDTIANC